MSNVAKSGQSMGRATGDSLTLAMAHLAELPPDMLLVVLSFLSIGDMHTMSQVNTTFKLLVQRCRVDWNIDRDFEATSSDFLDEVMDYIQTFPLTRSIGIDFCSVSILQRSLIDMVPTSRQKRIATQIITAALQLEHLESLTIDLNWLDANALKRILKNTPPIKDKVRTLKLSWEWTTQTDMLHRDNYAACRALLEKFSHATSICLSDVSLTGRSYAPLRHIFSNVTSLEVGMFMEPSGIVELCTHWKRLQELRFPYSDGHMDYEEFILPEYLHLIMESLQSMHTLQICADGVVDGNLHFAENESLRSLHIVGDKYSIVNLSHIFRKCPNLKELTVAGAWKPYALFDIFDSDELESLSAEQLKCVKPARCH